MISGSKCAKSKNLEIWNYGDPEILFLEGVIFLHKFFTKSMISGSKFVDSKITVWKVSRSFKNLHKIGDIWLETQKLEQSEIRDCW